MWSLYKYISATNFANLGWRRLRAAWTRRGREKPRKSPWISLDFFGDVIFDIPTTICYVLAIGAKPWPTQFSPPDISKMKRPHLHSSRPRFGRTVQSARIA